MPVGMMVLEFAWMMCPSLTSSPGQAITIQANPPVTTTTTTTTTTIIITTSYERLRQGVHTSGVDGQMRSWSCGISFPKFAPAFSNMTTKRAPLSRNARHMLVVEESPIRKQELAREHAHVCVCLYIFARHYSNASWLRTCAFIKWHAYLLEEPFVVHLDTDLIVIQTLKTICCMACSDLPVPTTRRETCASGTTQSQCLKHP
jgi:hypothetical protein